jgi:acetyl-CoA synthetase
VFRFSALTAVEEYLMKHEAVAWVGVIGVPDPIRGEIVTAFILPREGVTPDKVLENSIIEHVKKRLDVHAYPREMTFLKDMSTTKTDKILKQKLRELHQKSKDPGPEGPALVHPAGVI